MKKFLTIAALIGLMMLMSGCIGISKSADRTEAHPGDIVTYTIVLSYETSEDVVSGEGVNVQQLDLSGPEEGFWNVKVEDSLVDLGEKGDIGSLSSDDFPYIINYEYVVTEDDIGDLINTATVTYNYYRVEGEETGEDESTFKITVTKKQNEEPIKNTPPPSPAVEVLPLATYNITSSNGNGGTISPHGELTVAEGESQTYTITPRDNNYEISNVLVDGTHLGAVETYTFENVTADHSIYVDFGIMEKVGEALVSGEEVVETAGISEDVVEVAGEMEELPYTGFNGTNVFMGLGMLLAGSGLAVALMKLRKNTL
ncbi:MAG: hypothetical protein PHN32_08160 [Actinomycetota bacterium]|nr:hypothetical protein [Actinomycetota bacterium]